MLKLMVRQKIFLYLILSTPPLLYLLFMQVVSKIRGPFFLGSNLDPSYAYLFNALSISQGLPVGHIDHPGTPVQSLGAVVINFLNFVNHKPDVISEVLKNPEYFLDSIFIAIISINFFTLLLITFVSFYLTKKLWISLMMGFTPFFSLNLLLGNLLVMPEPLLLTASLILVLALLILFFTDKNLKLILFLSIFAIGLGIASKITFFPLLFIPFLSIPTIRAKMCLLLGSAFSFYLLTIPITPFYSDLYNWIKALLFHSGRHGQGENAIIDTAVYFPNIIKTFQDVPIFSIILFIAIITLGLALLNVIKYNSSRDKQKNVHKKQLVILISLIFVQIFQVLLVAKHPGSSYLIPALSLSPITLMIVVLKLPKILSYFDLLKNIKLTPLFIYLILIGTTYQVFQIKEFYPVMQKNNNQITQVSKIVEEKYSQDIVVSYFRSSSKFYAMRFGNTFARDALTAHLTNIYPDVYFWDIWNARFSDWSSRIVTIDEIIKKQGNKKIIFHGTSFEKGYADNPNYKPKIPMEDLLNGEEETIYQVVFKNH